MGLFSSKCTSEARLDGKIAVITGANTGIGKETAMDLYRRGACVILACRNSDKGREVIEDIKSQCKDKEHLGELKLVKLDLMSLASVRECAQEIIETEDRIDLLINNAGVMMCPKGYTEDGFEIQFGTNHLGHFLFTLLLLPKIIDSKPARIVNLSSVGHIAGVIDFEDLNYKKKKYNGSQAYAQSKLANVLFSIELARRLAAKDIKGVNVYSLHPGIIATDLGRHIEGPMSWIWFIISRPLGKTPQQGAQTTIYCAVDEKCANETGLYYSDCAVKQSSTKSRDPQIAARLWEESLALVGLPADYDPFVEH